MWVRSVVFASKKFNFFRPRLKNASIYLRYSGRRVGELASLRACISLRHATLVRMEASTPTDGSGKRSRKPKTFAGYVTETNEGYFEEGEQGLAAAAPAAEQQQQQPQTKRRRSSTASASTLSTPKRQQQQNSSSGLVANNPAAAGGSVRKVAGVQNATKRALEWLQYGDLSVSELTQSLPKLSKARVEIVMEALRAAGLVTLVRKHEPDASVR